MKVTFFYAKHESLGVAYLSAVLKKAGFFVDLVFSDRKKKSENFITKALYKSEEMYADEILATNPDLIAFSSTTDTFPRDLNLAGIIKSKDYSKKIIFGGLHPTTIPELVIAEPAVDYLCVGEGEEAIVDLVTAIRDKKPITNIPNIWIKDDNNKVYRNNVRPLIENLDSIPFYDKDINGGAKGILVDGKFYGVLAGRGCYNSCTFCYNFFAKKLNKNASSMYLRFRSVDNVIAELRQAKENYGVRYINFYDDIFFYGKDWMDDFLDKYEKYINLPFACNLHVDFVTDDLIRKFQKAAASRVTVVLAAESVNYKTRKNLFGRKEKNESIADALRILKKHNVFIISQLIVRLPIENERSQLVEAAWFFNKNRVNVITIFPLRYYPNFQITQIAFEKGFLSESDMDKINRGLYLNEGVGDSVDINNLAMLVFVSGLFPQKILKFLIRKMKDRKDSKFFIFVLFAYWFLVEAGRHIYDFYLFKRKITVLLIWIKYIVRYHLKESPKNVFCYIRNYA